MAILPFQTFGNRKAAHHFRCSFVAGFKHLLRWQSNLNTRNGDVRVRFVGFLCEF